MSFTLIDLFAGAGGLSLGFSQTNQFEIKLAAENNPDAQKTYRRNNPKSDIVNDVRDINYNTLKGKYGEIDVVIGGPPCQGFSNVNRQKNHTVSTNNILVKEYVRAVIDLKPKVFVMENVSMLKSDTHRFYYSETDRVMIENLGIKMKEEILELLPKGISLENIEEIILDKSVAESYFWPKEMYSTFNILYKQKKHTNNISKRLEKYKFKIEKFCNNIIELGDNSNQIKHWDFKMAKDLYDILMNNQKSLDSIYEIINRPILIQKMLFKLEELRNNYIIPSLNEFEFNDGVYVHLISYSVLDYITTIFSMPNSNYKILPCVLNAAEFGVPQKRIRFVLIGVKKELEDRLTIPETTVKADEFRTVRDAIEDLENIEPDIKILSNAKHINNKKNVNINLSYLRDSELLYNHVATASRETAKKRFEALKPGQNFHDLSLDLKDTYTDASRTQNTIYMRLNYDEPSGTVVNVRKSMWIHPAKDRALSIREAARLQTFPDSFVFEGTKDSQYQQVGNAVPPRLANAIANKVLEILKGF